MLRLLARLLKPSRQYPKPAPTCDLPAEELQAIYGTAEDFTPYGGDE